MKNISTPPRAALVGALSLTALSLGVSAPAHAISNFTGAYAVSNWTTSTLVGGSVDTSGAPNSISLTSPNSGSPGNVDFTIAAAGNGTVFFDWSYTTSDFSGSPSFDLFGYLLNGAFTQLTNNDGGIIQGGTANLAVIQGDIFGFRTRSTNGIDGPATTTITNFDAPTATPVPLESDALPVVASAAFMAGGLWWKRRRAKAKVADFVAQK